MEELAPKRKRLAAPPEYGENGTGESELVEIIEDRRDERREDGEREREGKTTVVTGKKRKGRT